MRNRLVAPASSPRLLIAADFDGTLAPIVARPDLARPVPEAMALLHRAAALAQTSVAIVSGRSMDDLRRLVGPAAGLWLVGGHGAELDGPAVRRDAENVELVLEAIAEPLRRAAPPGAGFLHERKPTGIAVHYRAVDPALARDTVAEIVESIAAPAGLGVLHGKMVLELLAVDADKGRAIQTLQRLTGATATVYLGDDTTDEDAFRKLGPGDLGVRIGDGATEADLVVDSIDEARELLANLLELRGAWVREIRGTSIERFSILSDQRTLAVVGPDAEVAWLCLPRVDGPAVFSSLLGGSAAGAWSVAPADGGDVVGQAYETDTFTLVTSWPTLRVTDYLDCSGGRSFQRAGRTDLVRVLEGRGRVRVRFSPRLDFGRSSTTLLPVEGGLVIEGAADPMVLVAPGVAWTIEERDGGQDATALIDLVDEPVVLELRDGTRSLAPSRIPEAQRRSQTGRAWSGWTASLRLPRVATELCRRSALVLRALCYGPTGAILAAGTTSLPESAGGVRNWDYRYSWPRDAAVAAAALVRLGNTGVAMRYLDWLLGVVDRCAGPERLRPLYAVTGEELGPEAELSHLAGYRASRPVRIGNAASHQVQFDVFGVIVDLVHRLAEAGAAISPDHWRLVEAMALAVERAWHEPDHGIWEVRTRKRHHVHSKVMCWLALDRAAKLADQFAGERRTPWEALRDRIAEDVLEHGFDAQLGAFVAAYDLREPDASALVTGLHGLVAPSDRRFAGTVELVRSRLLEGGTVLRYRYDDGLPGGEGGFHLCTGWLAESMLLLGRRDEAWRLFESLCSAAGPTGMLSEQWCPAEGTALGNVPQAYSHAALINLAVALDAGQ